MGSQPTQSAQAQDKPFESYLARIETVLKQIIHAGGFALDLSISKAPAAPDDPEAPEWMVNFSGRDAEIVLESHAALLDAMASVALKAARLDESRTRRIAFDCQNYRHLRAIELRLMAQLAAERAMESHEPFDLSPMNAAERRLVHLALRGETRVRTESQGFGPTRKVIIYPAESQKSK